MLSEKRAIMLVNKPPPFHSLWRSKIYPSNNNYITVNIYDLKYSQAFHMCQHNNSRALIILDYFHAATGRAAQIVESTQQLLSLCSFCVCYWFCPFFASFTPFRRRLQFTIWPHQMRIESALLANGRHTPPGRPSPRILYYFHANWSPPTAF